MSFISTAGLSSMKSYTSCEPSRKEATTLPLSMALAAPLMTPALIRRSSPSANISVCKPRFLCPPNWAARAFGRDPIPIWIQAPSATSSEQFLPMRISVGEGSANSLVISGVSSLTRKSNMSRGTRSPRAKGTWGFTTPIFTLADSRAAMEQSTEVPRETIPSASGRETWTIAAPSFIAPLL